LTSALRQVQHIDLSEFATKAEMKAEFALLRAEMDAKLAELKADLIRWVLGVGFAQVAAIVALLKLLPGGHP
jgi:hypothetical protein